MLFLECPLARVGGTSIRVLLIVRSLLFHRVYNGSASERAHREELDHVTVSAPGHPLPQSPLLTG